MDPNLGHSDNNKIEVTLHVNGEKRCIKAYPFARLLDALRTELGLTGTKEGCGEGECGACAVLMDDMLVNSCLVPIAQAHGHKILTIEGIVETELGRRLVSSFRNHGGSQCGICTPGMLTASYSLLKRIPDPDEATIRRSLSGNLCRCTGYSKIFLSIAQAARKD